MPSSLSHHMKWWRGSDFNRLPLGYEPSVVPNSTTARCPRQDLNLHIRGYWFLRPARLPFRHEGQKLQARYGLLKDLSLAPSRSGEREGTGKERQVGLTTRRLQTITRVCQPSTFRSEEHTYELTSLMRTSYAVFCLQKKNQQH